MKALFTHFVIILTLVLCGSMITYAQDVAPIAYAVPLTDITIDGMLDDWPEKMAVYPIAWVSKYYKPAPPEGPEDLSAGFRVGYNAETGVLYLALIAQDDDLVVHPESPNFRTQDACEIYIDGDHSGGDNTNDITGAQQYVMVAGPGLFKSTVQSNPGISGRIITVKPGLQCAYSRVASFTTYEWAIPLYESYPDKRVQITAEKTIGLDVAVTDADGEESGNWVAWAPEAGKFSNSNLFGDLIFVEDYRGLDVALLPVIPEALKNHYADLGSLAGTAIMDSKPFPELLIDIYQGDKKLNSIRSDGEGRYHLKIQPGEYTLKVARGQGVKKSEVTGITVKARQENRVAFDIMPVELPEALVKSASVYKSLTGYRDTTVVEMHMVRPGMDNRMTSQIFFAFEEPNRVRVESIIDTPMGGVDLFSNGEKLISYMGMWKQYTEEDAPEMITSDKLRMIQSVIVNNIILSKDMGDGIEEVKAVGSEMLDGVSTTTVELMQTAGSLGANMFSGGTGDEMLIPVKLWIGNKESLIRKVAYELDMEQLSKNMPEAQRTAMKGMKMSITEMHTEIETDPAFSASDFAFTPPEGAQLVDNFSPPGRPKPEEDKSIGKPAPDFALKDITGDEAKLSDFEGKVVLVDFWATWCGPCIKAMPHIQTLFELYKEEDVVVLGINSWEREKDKVETFLKEHKITYRILLDSNDEVIGKYGVSGIPTFFIIDKKGIIRYSYTGLPSNRQIIQQNVEEILAE